MLLQTKSAIEIYITNYINVVFILLRLMKRREAQFSSIFVTIFRYFDRPQKRKQSVGCVGDF